MHERVRTGSPGNAAAGATAVSPAALEAALLDQASAPYRRAGRFAYHFARGKLHGDPIYRAVLERGLLSGRRRVLDLGCGEGLLAAWLRAARLTYERGGWTPAWPPPPCPDELRGIELAAARLACARAALGAEFELMPGDIRSAAFGSADAIVIMDVLHYLPAESHREVLEHARAALPERGLLILRVGDAEAGWRFRFSVYFDQLVLLLRRQGLRALNCRGVGEWRELLRECGFDSRIEPLSGGGPFANVLLIAHAR